MAAPTPREVARRLRNQTRRAARDLQAWEAAQTQRERFGRFELAPGEQIDQDEVVAFLERARREHPQQHIEITVTATAATDQPSPE